MGSPARRVMKKDNSLKSVAKAVKNYIAKANELFDQGDYSNAISNLDEAIRIDPTSAGAYYNRSRVKYKIEQYFEAISDLDETIQSNNAKEAEVQ